VTLRSFRRLSATLGAFVIVNASPSFAQPEPRKIQRAGIMQRVADTEIRVVYMRPVARGRELFGKLVPFGKMWTPSADSAMRVTFSTDVQIEGQPVKAGSYSVWTIPDSSSWTIILNSNPAVFHLSHKESEDVIRFTAKAESLPHVETLSLTFPLVDARKAVMQIQWGPTAVALKIDAP
jgi:hypothetical protein